MNSYLIKILKSLTILYIDTTDELTDNLKSLSKKVYSATTKKDALILYKNEKIDIIVTEVELKDSSGIDLIQIIREDNKDIPIIITTKSTELKYILPAITLLLTDYLVKPVANSLLVKSLAKAVEQVILINKSNYKFTNGLNFDLAKKVIYDDTKEIKISSNEYKLLSYLIKNSHRTVSSEELELMIWNEKIVTNLALRSLVNRLRKKIGNDTITNITGLGYRVNIHH